MSDSQTIVGETSSEKGHHLHFHHDVRQPIPFLLPTGGTFTSSDPSQPPLKWSSRSSRKNRSQPKSHRVTSHLEEEHDASDSMASAMEARLQSGPFKPHLETDCSFWVAVIFTLGSTVWVINGCLLFLPLYIPTYPSHTAAANALAFVGGSLFEVGAYLMLAEAMNSGHEEMFQGPLSRFVNARKSDSSSSADHLEKGGQEHKGQSTGGKNFRWWAPPAWHDIGYLASFIQMMAASIFWIATISGIPGVIPELATDPPVVITDIFYWTPQVIGGTGFMIASILLMIETQRKWWLPNVTSVGWHVGFWNFVGGTGFMLCGAFGYLSLDVDWENYQSVISTFWGSWAFLIGSVIQLYETLWREPAKQPEQNEKSK